jgi:hypothetical protein
MKNGAPRTKDARAENLGATVGGSAPERTAEPTPKPASKIDRVIDVLSRPDGATLDELVVATDWQPHTTRAALTGLKKKGRAVTSEKIDGVRRYRVGKPS